LESVDFVVARRGKERLRSLYVDFSLRSLRLALILIAVVE
jgi:hypothetical protein